MTEVLIVGAGPTGLSLAIELLRRGVQVRLIDQASEPCKHSKALAIQARTLELFDKMGVAKEMVAKGLPLGEVVYHCNGYSSVVRLSFPQDVPFPFVLVLPQSATEKILLEQLQRLGGKVERGVSFVGLEGKTALLRHASGVEEQIECDWTIGCDGAHSALRHALKTPFQGRTLTERFLIADLSLETLLSPLQGHIYLTKTGPCFLLPLPEAGRFRLICQCSEGERVGEEMLTPAFFQELLQSKVEGCSMLVQDVHWASLFHVNRRIVPHMQFGQVFLAGDAAHIHSPAGGQGLNTSVQDACNLAWKLALVIKGEAPRTLLQSYEKERHPVAKSVLAKTGFATRLLSLAGKVLRNPLFWVLATLFRSHWVIQQFTRNVSEIAVNYRKSPIVGEPLSDLLWSGPRPGERAPDAALCHNGRLYNYLKDTRHVLLDFSDDPSSAALQTQLCRYDKHVRLLRVCRTPDGEGAIYDPANLLHRAYAAKQGSLYLIRPDGYIAFRSKQGDEKALQEYLKKIFWY